MDILSIGEILIDLTQTGVNAEGVPLYEARGEDGLHRQSRG